MRITLDTEVLRKYNLSLGQFIVLLTSYYSLDCQKIHDELVNQRLAERDLFKGFPPVLSDNTKNIVAKILVESDDKIRNCGIKDFDGLAEALQQVYPEGVKPGKTYSWRGETDLIAQKLRTLVAKYSFTFTEEEAIRATQEYVDSFQSPYTYMHTLRNFLLFTKKENGSYTMESTFMEIIENNRKKDENNN